MRWLTHGDAAAALLSGRLEINNHFSAPPFQYMEAKAPGVRRITSAQDILGAPATYMVAYATEKFRAENPKTYAAFVAALRQTLESINKDPRAAAKDYLDASKDPISVDDATAMITDNDGMKRTCLVLFGVLGLLAIPLKPSARPPV